MGVPTSEVGYTIATTRRETTKVHKNMWWHTEEKSLLGDRYRHHALALRDISLSPKSALHRFSQYGVITDPSLQLDQVTRGTQFCTVSPNVCGSSEWNLFHVTFMAP